MNTGMTSLKAVIFDLDGTLLDTIEDIADSMNRVLVDHGYPVHDPEDYRRFVGEGLEAMVSLALPGPERKGTIVSSCLAAMRKIYAGNYAHKTRPYKGIKELLAELAKRKIGSAVLSNKFDQFTKLMISEYFPTHHFDAVLGARPNVPHKPDPTSALEIARQLQVLPQEIVFVGDSGIDMRTALNAGMFPAGALWGYRSAEELKTDGARILLGKPEELLSYMN
jgi:phosphoglycolate phosphatase